ATIVSRINSGDINLQPHFQRGEVWSEAKRQKLIDSILRDWRVPPIHVIEVKESAKARGSGWPTTFGFNQGFCKRKNSQKTRTQAVGFCSFIPTNLCQYPAN